MMKDRKTGNILLGLLVLNLTVLNFMLFYLGIIIKNETEVAKIELSEAKESFQQMVGDIEETTTLINERSKRAIHYLDSLDQVLDHKLIMQRKSGKYEITIQESEEKNDQD